MKDWGADLFQRLARLRGPIFASVIAALLLSGLVLFGLAARASAKHSGNGQLSVCITPQRAGDDPAGLLAGGSRFDCARPASDWGPGSYWVRLNLPAASAVASADAPPRQLRFVPQWQRGIAIYTRDASGTIFARWFDDADLSHMVRIGAAIGLPVEERGRPVTDVLLRIDGAVNAAGLIGDPQLLDSDSLHREELVATAAFAAFAGLGIGLFCYNIVLWLTIRERFQLTYCLSLLAMLAYAWTSSGAMAVEVPTVPHTARLLSSYLMLAFVAALALQFITDFIEPGKLPRRLRFIARHHGLLCIAAALGVVLVPSSWGPGAAFVADRIYLVSFMPLPFLVIAVTTVAWRRGSNSVRVLAIAWAVPLVMALVRIAHALHLIDYGLVVQYSLVAAMSIEALLSSLAMSFRIKLLTDDRDRARADERAARHLASVDSLTGLLNRRALLEQVLDWQSPEPLRLLLVDIDHFKRINDAHGHLVGDEVLREVAEVLAIRADLRGSVARMGGEEFCLIGTADELHEGIALGILSDIRSRSMAGTVRLTVSIGMSDGMVHSEDDWRELYRRADDALYQAKAAGRNRVSSAHRDYQAALSA